MATIRRSIRAEADLDEILEALHLRNPTAAHRLAVNFDSECRALAKFPEMGRRRDDLASGLRSVLVQPYILSLLSPPGR